MQEMNEIKKRLTSLSLKQLNVVLNLTDRTEKTPELKTLRREIKAEIRRKERV